MCILRHRRVGLSLTYHSCLYCLQAQPADAVQQERQQQQQQQERQHQELDQKLLARAEARKREQLTYQFSAIAASVGVTAAAGFATYYR